MIFEDRNRQFHLFDEDGYVVAASAGELLARHAERVRRSLAYPLALSDYFYFHLIKDGRGRIWWTHWEADWGAVDDTTVISGQGAVPEVEIGSGRRHRLLFPLGDEGRVLVALDRANVPGVIANVSNGQIKKVAAAPVADIEQQNTQPMAIRDRSGRNWVNTPAGCCALDSNGKLIARHPGQIVLEDSKGGLWFHVDDHRRDTPPQLVRLAADGHEARQAFPGLRPFRPLAESPDGTFWVATGKTLTRLRSEGQKLTTGEQIAAPPSDYFWCDRDGRVWLAKGSHEGEAVRLAVNAPASPAAGD
jgi:hypothetical protein